MPFGREGIEPGLGLALSGGGFRATLFHLGSLWRLNELGFLPRLDRISSISGGSITAGLLGVRWHQLQFTGGVAANFGPVIVDPLRAFCGSNVDLLSLARGVFLPWKRVSDEVEAVYRNRLLGSATLQDLPDRPRFVINATNFATGVSFRFSKPYCGDYRIGLMRNPQYRVSLAVTASSAFPPVLSPVVIDVPDPSAFERTEGADLYDEVDYRKRLALTDGGVYDNLGLETVWGRYQTVLVSDAGAPFDLEDHPGGMWTQQVKRALDVATDQSRALRKRMLIQELQQPGRSGAYWGIATGITKYGVADALPCPAAAIARLARTRTRLNRFTEQEQCELINWGYAVADAALRCYLPPADPLPPAWPYPAFRLDR